MFRRKSDVGFRLHAVTRNHELGLDYWHGEIDRPAGGLSFPQE